MNGAGLGAFFNTMNFGQALMLHIVFVPLVLVAIVGIHILMVRLRGVSHPIDAIPEHLDLEGALGAGAPGASREIAAAGSALPAQRVPGAGR
jgi:hypothetical protein